ncbi:Ig-like domain repeat protein, partial [uncultured Aeromicrobium sp.]|uniref:Ig-like domain repeat protein n=1 Tax=uncultured Aeromicrobium sp. TaxID=337820 RepID=UPI0025E1A50F
MAGPGQGGQPQVTLNPGGGVAADGTDGLRFTINAASGSPGQDFPFYRNTRQYLYSAGGPMLSIGRQLYGQAGPAGSYGRDWNSIEIVSTSGVVAQGALTSETGNGSATVRYTAVRDGLSYVMTRTVSYTYPNDFVTDSYEFTIPEGNTVPVKFYLGGDTAPGGSDVGQGVMLTSPVRSIFSVNPNSQIQFGFREVPGSKPFDGATAGVFNIPYVIVRDGGDIGFAVNPEFHDAGLMMQWNLGTAPGTQRAALRQGVSARGVNLTAGFDRESVAIDGTARLDISIENTGTENETGLGLTFTYPDGLTPGATTSTCGDYTVTGSVGTLTNGSVAGAQNCLISTEFTVEGTAPIELSAANFTAVTGMFNSVGTSTLTVLTPPAYAGDEALGAMTVGNAASGSVAAADPGNPVATYSVVSGALPAGVDVDPETGALSGSPTTAGAFTATVRASNSAGQSEHTFSGTVAKGETDAGISIDPASVEYGTSSTLSVTGLPAAATGAVDFRAGDQTLCSVTLPATSCATEDDLATGDHQVTAVYPGDANWNGSTSDAAPLEVVRRAAAVSGGPASSSVAYREDVTINAGVDAPGATGDITVTSGERTLCVIELPGTSCTVEDTLPAGSYPLTGAYSGDVVTEPATGSLGTLTVTQAVLDLQPEDVDAVYGETIRFDLPLPEDATGTVVFSVGDTELCRYDVATADHCVAGGDSPEARFSLAAAAILPAGVYDLAVTYSGDDNYASGAGEATLTVAKATPPIVAEDLEGTFAEPIEFAVDKVPGDATGTVSIVVADSGVVLCEYAVADGSCTSEELLEAGDWELAALYSGDDNYEATVSPFALTVLKATATVDAPESITVKEGERAAFDVTVDGEFATGTVTVRDGSDVLCVVTLPDTSCVLPRNLDAGTRDLAVVYSGDDNYTGAQATTDLTVEAVPVASRGDDRP